MTLKTLPRMCAQLVLFLASVAPVMAQGLGSIGGNVVDVSGGALLGASVTLTVLAGGVGSGQSTTTNDQGAYQFTRLVPGIYLVTAALQGFRTAEQRNIEVNSDRVRGDLTGLVGVAAMPRKDHNVPRVVCPEKRG